MIFIDRKFSYLKSHGISLIEMSLGLIILSIIASSILTVTLSSIKNWKDKSTIDSIYNYLVQKRQESLIKNKTIEIPLSKLINDLKIHDYKLTFKGFYNKNLIVFSSNSSSKKDYSNGTLYINSPNSIKNYKLTINKTGKIANKNFT